MLCHCQPWTQAHTICAAACGIHQKHHLQRFDEICNTLLYFEHVTIFLSKHISKKVQLTVTGGKVLNTPTDIYVTLVQKAFVGKNSFNESFKLGPFFHTNSLHEVFLGPLLWTLSIDFQIGFKSGDWLGQSSNLTCAFYPPNMVCIMASKEFRFFLLIWPDYVLPVYHRLVQMLCSKLETSFNMLFLQKWSLVWWYRPWRLRAFLIVFFEDRKSVV